MKTACALQIVLFGNIQKTSIAVLEHTLKKKKKQKKGANKEFDQYFKKYFDRWIFTKEHEIPIFREF